MCFLERVTGLVLEIPEGIVIDIAIELAFEFSYILQRAVSFALVISKGLRGNKFIKSLKPLDHVIKTLIFFVFEGEFSLDFQIVDGFLELRGELREWDLRNPSFRGH